MRISFIIILLINVLLCRAQQDIKKYVQQHAVTIPTIDPDSTTYTDLEPVGNAIGDASIVMLGEQDHGDAPTFLAKTRLIKYLHEKKGFNVLAFECDFFGLNQGWDELPKNKPAIDSFLRKNVYPIWTYCPTCKDLFFDYIPAAQQTSNPLIISGFDNQLAMYYSYEKFTNKFDSVLQSLNLPFTHSPEYTNDLLPALIPINYGRHTDSDMVNYDKWIGYLLQIKKQAAQKLQPGDFWLLIIDNLVQSCIEYRDAKKDYRNSSRARDEQMANNLAWLKAHKFPGQKIIVWAANYHIAKYVDSLQKDPPVWLATMGHFFTADSSLAKTTYVLGFDSYEGTAGRLGFKNFTVKKPASNGFENWMDQSARYMFTDFTKYNSEFPGPDQEFYMKALDHNNLKKAWNKLFDGIFYIRDMYPCNQNPAGSRAH